MEDYLLFHLVDQSEWKAAKQSNTYSPDSLKDEGFIHLSKGSQVEATANRLFKGKQDLLLLVIDKIRLAAPIKYEDTEGEGEKFPHLYGELNMDAVIDTIRLKPDDDGNFSIDVQSD
ncbi:MAG: DUF952 domain-containing protein [Bacteroidota bacterium]